MKAFFYLFFASALAVRAATLTTVPMQGGMVMPMIKFNESAQRLSVTLDSTLPQLTPLLISNPGDQFDPAAPWFQHLDPSREGRSFSRRYGFVMDSMSDPLPANRAISLRRLSASGSLGFYRYRASAPMEWTPIFGTEGTTNAMPWNGMMFHPGITAPPATNALTATFEAFLVDTTTGAELPETSTGPFVLNWTNISDGRPSVSIGWKPAISWPADATNWILERAESLTATNWTTVTNVPTPVEGAPAVLIEGGSNHFYRMRRAP